MGPPATTPQESEGAAADTPSAVGTIPEAQKLTYVLSELLFDQLNIKAGLKDRLTSLVKENLNAFAGTPHDLGHTDLVLQRILTGDAPPFRHQLRYVPFARRQYLK